MLLTKKEAQYHYLMGYANPKEGYGRKASGRLSLCEAQVSKLKAMGYKSPEEVEAEKIVSYQVGSVDQREWLEKDGWLEWDREKVAKEYHKTFAVAEKLSDKSWDALQDSVKLWFLSKADQLKEILTGGE